MRTPTKQYKIMFNQGLHTRSVWPSTKFKGTMAEAKSYGYQYANDKHIAFNTMYIMEQV